MIENDVKPALNVLGVETNDLYEVNTPNMASFNEFCYGFEKDHVSFIIPLLRVLNMNWYRDDNWGEILSRKADC